MLGRIISKTVDLVTGRRDKLYTMISVLIHDDGYVMAEQLCSDCEYDEAKSYIDMSEVCMGRPANARLYMVDQEKVVAFMQRMARKHGGRIACHHHPSKYDFVTVN